MEENIINLQFGAFLSSNEVKLTPLVEAIGVKLMLNKGTKLSDNSLMSDKSGKYFVAMLELSNKTVWVYVPIDYPLIKRDVSGVSWALVKPQQTTLTEEEFNLL